MNYLKPPGNAPKTYEVKPGLINSLHVFGELIPELRSFLQLNEKSSFKEISEGLNSLCSYLFSNDASWTWSGIDENDNLFKKGDIYESIIFRRNQEDVLYWEHDLKHTSLECLASNASRFSKEECEWMGKRPLTRGFLDLMDLVKSGAQVDVHGFSDIILSTNYRSVTAKIHAFYYIFRLNFENLKPLGFSLVRELVDVDEESTNNRIALQFSKMIRGKSLSEPDAKRILEENPPLLSESILTDQEKHIYDSVADALIETNHQDWLIKVAPECFSLSINGNQTETLKILLPHFSSLLTLELHLENLSGLKAILEENILKSQNLEMFLWVKAFNPALPWFEEWLHGQKNNVFIFPYSFVDSKAEDNLKQLTKLFATYPKVKMGLSYLKEEDQEIVLKALSSPTAKEDEEEDPL